MGLNLELEKQQKYLSALEEVNLNLEVEPLNYLAKIMGKDLWEKPGKDEINSAVNWIHSPLKRRFDRLSALIIARAGGKFFIELAERKVKEVDGQDPTYSWEGGFFSSLDNRTVYSSKIRTMRINAEHEFNTPFEHTCFTIKKPGEDDRVLDSPFVHFLRRTGFDSLPEVVCGVTSGDYTLVGPRPYTTYELEGIEFLYKLRGDRQLGLSCDAIEVLSDYPGAIDIFKPKPGLFSPLSAFYGRVSVITRMYGDLFYLRNASLPTDFRLVFGGMLQRFIRGASAT